ncbi:MAG TPA: Clp protease N-terminal domain-containing protein [Acidimicrobiales bacterium]|nr:Clp protease N-terminal domain-containing protein [Acidimicrobiales bacterium]
MLCTVFERFDEKSRRVMELARQQARQLGHGAVGPEHILLGIATEGNSAAAALLRDCGFNPLSGIAAMGWKAIGAEGEAGEPASFSSPARTVLELSRRAASKTGMACIGTEHLLGAALDAGEGSLSATQLLRAGGAEPDKVREGLLFLRPLSAEASGETSAAMSDGGRAPGEPAPLAVPKRDTGPRCARCGRSFADFARYRPARVPGQGVGRAPALVQVVFCEGCGCVYGTTPFPVASDAPADASPDGNELLQRPNRVVAAMPASPAAQAGMPWPASRTPSATAAFPADLLVPTSLAGNDEGRIDLRYEPSTELLQGDVGPHKWALQADFKGNHGWMRGSANSDDVAVAWHFGSSDSLRPSGRVTGRFGDQPVGLEGQFRLDHRFMFDGAPVEGTLGGLSFRAGVSAATGGLEPPARTVVARGLLGDTTFEIFATLSPGAAHLRGSVGREPLSVDVHMDGPRDQLHISGHYQGETPFLALLIGAVLHFV